MNKTLFELPEPEEPKQEIGEGKPRLKRANRQQVEWRPVDLDSQIGEDHAVRLIWELAQGVDLKPYYNQIKAIEGQAGQSAIDPRILLALWMFATIQGVGSARELDRLCREHDAYRWLCGGVSVNYHTLADFRVAHGELLERLFTQSVASLAFDGLVNIEWVAHDGKKVCASAGSASFRRRPSLEKCQKAAQQQVELLRQELEQNPGAASERQKAARERAGREREQRVKAALKRMEELEARQEKRRKKTNQEKREVEPRASTTDPEAHRMKMADGGTRPAYNLQISSDVGSKLILAVEVSNQGNDSGLMLPSVERVTDQYPCSLEAWLTDGGFVHLQDITAVEQRDIRVYAPVPKPRKAGVDPHAPKQGDTPQVSEWRARMATAEAKAIYKQRAATAEWVNAWLDNWGLQRLRVRGAKKVKAVLALFALTFNLLQGYKLRLAAAERSALAV